MILIKKNCVLSFCHQSTFLIKRFHLLFSCNTSESPPLLKMSSPSQSIETVKILVSAPGCWTGYNSTCTLFTIYLTPADCRTVVGVFCHTASDQLGISTIASSVAILWSITKLTGCTKPYYIYSPKMDEKSC